MEVGGQYEKKKSLLYHIVVERIVHYHYIE